VKRYEFLLRTAVHCHPELRARQKTCVKCGLPFLTHPRNQTRTDIHCPFGCRDTHRKASSTKRSVAYYRTPSGRRKKRELNQRRPRKTPVPGRRFSAPKLSVPVSPQLSPSPLTPRFSSEILIYLQTLAYLIDRIQLTVEEVWLLLRKKMRQPRIDGRPQGKYSLLYGNKDSP